MLESALEMMLGRQLHDLGERLANLGLRHVVYGVVKDHFKALEASILDTLELTLQQQWSKSLRKDWEGVLKFISKGMRVGADRGLSVKRRQLELGGGPVASLRLLPITSTCDAPALQGGRFDVHKNSPKVDPPKPAPRPKFDDFLLEDCNMRKEQQQVLHSPLPKTNSEPAIHHDIATKLIVDTSPTKQTPMGQRRHTSIDLSSPSKKGIKLPKLSSSPDPKSLLLRNELLGNMGLMGPAAGYRKKAASGSSMPRSRTDRMSQSERTMSQSARMSFEQFDASTSTWPVLGLEPDPIAPMPMLGLEPDAKPVLPKRQVSPTPSKRATTAKQSNNNNNNIMVNDLVQVVQKAIIFEAMKQQ